VHDRPPQNSATGLCENRQRDPDVQRQQQRGTTDTCDPATGANTDTKTPTRNDNNACTTDTCDPATGDA
jgi:hypothetical protein